MNQRQPCFCGHLLLDMPCSRMVAGKPLCNTQCHAMALKQVMQEAAKQLGFNFETEKIPRDGSFW